MAYFDDVKDVACLDLPWQRLSGCNILVTGATGLIGSCLIEVLMSHPGIDYHIYAMGRNEERARARFAEYFSDPFFHFLKHDVSKPLQTDVDFQFVIHAASDASPSAFANYPVEVIKSNILGVSGLMDYGICHGLRRFLYVSSGEVYGEGDGRDFTEEYSGYVNPLSPRSCYPSSKRAAETLCVSYGVEHAIDVVIARPCHIYGPNFTESDNRVYAQFIRNVLSGQDILMKSDGKKFRSWCYVVDCVAAILYILFKGESGQAYNIADPSSNITIKQLAEMIADICGRKVIVDIPSHSEEAGYGVISRSTYSTEKLQSLGWKIYGSMRMKIASTIEHRKEVSHI